MLSQQIVVYTYRLVPLGEYLSCFRDLMDATYNYFMRMKTKAIM